MLHKRKSERLANIFARVRFLNSSSRSSNPMNIKQCLCTHAIDTGSEATSNESDEGERFLQPLVNIFSIIESLSISHFPFSYFCSFIVFFFFAIEAKDSIKYDVMSPRERWVLPDQATTARVSHSADHKHYFSIKHIFTLVNMVFKVLLSTLESRLSITFIFITRHHSQPSRKLGWGFVSGSDISFAIHSHSFFTFTHTHFSTLKADASPFLSNFLPIHLP